MRIPAPRLVRDTVGGLLLLAALALVHAAEVGEPLGHALEQLAKSGLNIVYSTALVTPAMRVLAPPRAGPPVEVAREILAPHGLALEPVQPGAYVVVRRDLDGDAAIELIVERADGSPAAGAHVLLQPGERFAQSDAAGRLRFGSLPPGVFDAEGSDATGAAARLRLADTVCSATQDRQDALRELIGEPLDLLLVIGGVFVAEALSVMLQVGWFKFTKKKYGVGKRIFLMAPLHHHFEKSGWKETQVVVRFWIITMLLCLIGLASLKLR